MALGLPDAKSYVQPVTRLAVIKTNTETLHVKVLTFVTIVKFGRGRDILDQSRLFPPLCIGLDKFCRQNFAQKRRFLKRAFCRQNKAFREKSEQNKGKSVALNIRKKKMKTEDKTKLLLYTLIIFSLNAILMHLLIHRFHQYNEVM